MKTGSSRGSFAGPATAAMVLAMAAAACDPGACKREIETLERPRLKLPELPVGAVHCTSDDQCLGKRCDQTTRTCT